MAGPRRYQLLCPIARALDRVGDRWTLLILRDLHAGPARYSDLLSGLEGIASNLLTTRLQQLAADGLVRRREAEYGVALYELTELGVRSGDVLFELARLGRRFPPDEEIRPAVNLRNIAVTLQTACQRVITSEDEMTAGLVVDGEPFTLSVRGGAVDVHIGAPGAPDAVLTTGLEPMMAVGDGAITGEEFAAEHVTLTADDPARAAQLMSLLARAMALLARDR